MWFLVLQSTLYYLFMFLITLYSTTNPESMGLLSLLLIVSLIYFSFEIYQNFKENPLVHLRDLWNFLDFFGLSFLILHIILTMAGALTFDNINSQIILSIAVVFLGFRAIGYLRVFKNTRTLVRLVTEVLADMWSFVLLMVILVF